MPRSVDLMGLFKPFSRRDRRGLYVRSSIPPAVWRYLARREIQVELAALDRAGLAALAPPAPLVEVCEGRAVWALSVPGSVDCFMSLRPGAIDHDKFVVMANAFHFYRAWLQSTLELANLRRDNSVRLMRDMPADYKFHFAEDGFAVGRDNPVPLATVGSNPPDRGPSLHITDGVTRTFWLIAKGVRAFPVQVFHQCAATQLHKLVGIGPGPIRCADLFANATREF